MPFRALIAAVVALALSACADGDDGPGQCSVTQAAALPLARKSAVAISSGRINDTDVAVIVDTGFERSVIAAGLLGPLGLLSDARHGTLVTGVGGQGRPQNDVLVRSFSFGGYDPGDGHYGVINLPVRSKPPLLGGIVGANVLSHFDLDLDAAHDRLTLYSVHHCSGQFLPWTGAYTAVPLQVTWRGKLLLPVGVDGVALQAMLDTGSTSTVLDSNAAERFGLGHGALAAETSHNGSGAAGVDFQLIAHTFRELRVGTDSTAAPRLHILDRQLDEADMLLGMDWMAKRHVWISYRTHQLFIASP